VYLKTVCFMYTNPHTICTSLWQYEVGGKFLRTVISAFLHWQSVVHKMSKQHWQHYCRRSSQWDLFRSLIRHVRCRKWSGTEMFFQEIIFHYCRSLYAAGQVPHYVKTSSSLSSNSFQYMKITNGFCCFMLSEALGFSFRYLPASQ